MSWEHLLKDIPGGWLGTSLGRQIRTSAGWLGGMHVLGNNIYWIGGYFRSEDGVVCLWHFLVNLHIYSSSIYLAAYLSFKYSLVLLDIWDLNFTKLKSFWLLAHCLWWKLKMHMGMQPFSLFTTSSVLVLRSTSVFWGSPLRCSLTLMSLYR